ncbi:MAG TPA: toxin-antitoxin system YwqK family antitoxin [Candidatus Eisenbacteria bacterium]|nr:toxin-antitoxin system YwqK family antitoxin [Candidatus Eisenbacteria bacterium]
MRFFAVFCLLSAGLAADPPKDGTYVEKWPDGKLKLEAHYKDGKLHGLMRRWHENGQLAAHEEYENGKWEGRRAAWWDNGQVQFDWQYHEGKLREGTWKSFHKNGAFWTSWRMGAGGKGPDQEQVAYHDNGKIHYRGWWKNERQDGRWVYYHPDGTTKSEVRNYKEGLLHGWRTKWSEKGEVTERIEYRNGKPKK